MGVGEAPAKEEIKLGQPFVGRAGKELDQLFLAAGIRRGEVYLTNASLTPIPAGMDKERHFFECKGGPPTKHFLEDLLKLRADVQEIKPNVVIAFGNYALWAMMQHKDITNWRGSILWSKFHGVKVVPTLHPAALLRGATSEGGSQGGTRKLRPAVILDLERARMESSYQELRLRPRTLLVNPVGEEHDAAYQRLRAAKTLTFDIETFGGLNLACIGFSDGDPEWAVTWSFDNDPGRYALFKDLLESDVPKVGQNLMYDVTMLDQIGIHVRNITWDTMLASHVIIPDLPKGLDFLTSVYTDMPYYKEEGKTWREPDAKGKQQLYTYNAKDIVATTEIAQKQLPYLQRGKLMQVFRDEVARIEPLRYATYTGFKADKHLLIAYMNETKAKSEEAHRQLNEMAGWEVNTNSNGARGQVAKLISQRGLGTVSNTEAKTILNLWSRTGDPALRLIVDTKEYDKLLSTYYHFGILSPDGRIRTVFNPCGTAFGRLSSSKPLWGPGMNLQNIPSRPNSPGYNARRLFIADDGHVIIEADQIQAEAIITAYLANDPIHIDCFRTGKDVHRVTACLLTDQDPRNWKNIPKESAIRQLAKKCNHGFNYDMGFVTFMYVVNAEYNPDDPLTVRIDYGQAKAIREKYLESRPALPGYWEWVRYQLHTNDRTLVTPLGREYQFLDHWGDDLFKKAYSCIPQSTVGDTTNLGVIRVFQDSECKKAGVRFMLNGHDSAVFQIPEESLNEIGPRILKLMETELFINGYRIVVPIEGAYGSTWFKKDMEPLGQSRISCEVTD
jgi:uracil-DNA glycosylase family 4